MADHLSIVEVERIATLARLALTDDEKALYGAQLARILDYARQIGELDTGGIPPTAAVAAVASVERPDAEHDSLGRDAALSNAPDTAAGLFRVPKVLGDA